MIAEGGKKTSRKSLTVITTSIESALVKEALLCAEIFFDPQNE
jgi:hypothetical protein